jgi:hypothetical protein
VLNEIRYGTASGDTRHVINFNSDANSSVVLHIVVLGPRDARLGADR